MSVPPERLIDYDPYARYLRTGLPEEEHGIRPKQSVRTPQQTEEEPGERPVVFRVEDNPITLPDNEPEFPERQSWRWKFRGGGDISFKGVLEGVGTVISLPFQGLAWGGVRIADAIADRRDPDQKAKRQFEERKRRHEAEETRIISERERVDAHYKDQFRTDLGVATASLKKVLGVRALPQPDVHGAPSAQDRFGAGGLQAIRINPKSAQEILEAAETGKLGDKRTTEIGIFAAAQKARCSLDEELAQEMASVLGDSETQERARRILGGEANLRRVEARVSKKFPEEVVSARKLKLRLEDKTEEIVKKIARFQNELFELRAEKVDEILGLESGDSAESIVIARNLLSGTPRGAFGTLLAATRGEMSAEEERMALLVVERILPGVTREDLMALNDPHVQEEIPKLKMAILEATDRYGSATSLINSVLGQRTHEQSFSTLLKLAKEDSSGGSMARRLITRLAPDMTRQVEEYVALLADAATPGTREQLRGRKSVDARLKLSVADILTERTQKLLASIAHNRSAARALFSLMGGLAIDGNPSQVLQRVSSDPEKCAALTAGVQDEVMPEFQTDKITQDLITPAALKTATLIAGAGDQAEQAIIDALLYSNPETIRALEARTLAPEFACWTGRISTNTNEYYFLAGLTTAAAELSVPPGEFGELPTLYTETVTRHAARVLMSGVIQLGSRVEKEERKTLGGVCASMAAGLGETLPPELGRILIEETVNTILSQANPDKGPLALISDVRAILKSVMRHPEMKHHPAIAYESSKQIGRVIADIFEKREPRMGELARDRINAEHPDSTLDNLTALISCLPDASYLKIPKGNIPLTGREAENLPITDLGVLTNKPDLQESVHELGLPGLEGLTKQEAAMAMLKTLTRQIDRVQAVEEAGLTLTDEERGYLTDANYAAGDQAAPAERRHAASLSQAAEATNIGLRRAMAGTRVSKDQTQHLVTWLIGLFDSVGLALDLTTPSERTTGAERIFLTIGNRKSPHPLVEKLGAPTYEAILRDVKERFDVSKPPVSREEIDEFKRELGAELRRREEEVKRKDDQRSP